MNRDSTDLATALFLVLALVVGGWFLVRAGELIEPGQPGRSPVAVSSPSSGPGGGSPAPTAPGGSPSTGPSGSPGASTTESPAPTSSATASPGPIEVSVGAGEGFVQAVRTSWAQAAAIQAMTNILAGSDDGSRATQEQLRKRAIALTPAGEPRIGGMGPSSWAATLTELGYPYELRAASTRARALVLMAEAIQATGRPAGLVTRTGRDSWVVTGFRATDDPASGRPFSVTGVRIIDPWYPTAVAAWGKTVRPGSWVGAAGLERNLVRYEVAAGSYPDLEGKYLVVLPLPMDEEP